MQMTCITCSNISSNMFKIALRKQHFKRYFQKIFRGSAGPPTGIVNVSALRASQSRTFGSGAVAPKIYAPSGVIVFSKYDISINPKFFWTQTPFSRKKSPLAEKYFYINRRRPAYSGFFPSLVQIISHRLYK